MDELQEAASQNENAKYCFDYLEKRKKNLKVL
jgi:hypothetical protein